MATQKAASASRTGRPTAGKPRILRIGIVQGGRIVEERLIRKHDNISIGWSSKSTFSVPSESLPKQWLLFEANPRGYIAHFADAMDARIAVGNEVVSLAQLRQAGRLRRRGTPPAGRGNQPIPVSLPGFPSVPRRAEWPPAGFGRSLQCPPARSRPRGPVCAPK